MKLIKVIKKNDVDQEIVKTFGKVEAVIDPSSSYETHYIRGQSSVSPLDGESFKMARNAKEAAANIDKMVAIFSKHIKNLQAAKQWFLNSEKER